MCSNTGQMTPEHTSLCRWSSLRGPLQRASAAVLRGLQARKRCSCHMRPAAGWTPSSGKSESRSALPGHTAKSGKKAGPGLLRCMLLGPSGIRQVYQRCMVRGCLPVAPLATNRATRPVASGSAYWGEQARAGRLGHVQGVRAPRGHPHEAALLHVQDSVSPLLCARLHNPLLQCYHAITGLSDVLTLVPLSSTRQSTTAWMNDMRL